MSLQNLLSTGLEGDRINDLVKTAMNELQSDRDFDNYIGIVEESAEQVRPIFDSTSYFDEYRHIAENPDWFATSLLKAAEREGEGATRLWALSACSQDEREAELIKRHAIDESGHSVAYLSIFDYIFPDAVDPDFRKQLKALSPYYKMSDTPHEGANKDYAHNPTIDDYIQMNIAEIRTTIHHLLQREAIAIYCPEESRSRVNSLLDKLLRDELNHVAYTGELIEEYIGRLGRDKVARLYQRRLADFHDVTQEEVASAEFD